jgi:mannan endo-1,4-beta-mannosidase
VGGLQDAISRSGSSATVVRDSSRPAPIKVRLAGLASLLSLVAFGSAAFPTTGASDEFPFVEARGDRLYAGDEELRFISFNIPNLHYIEDDMRFEQDLPFRWPNEFEIRDALETVRQMGGLVVRPYALSVRKAGDPANMPRHVLAPGEFDEHGFAALDTVLAVAREKGIRVVIPLVDNWHWWGGVAEYSAFRGKPRDAFWDDAGVIADFKQTIRFLVERVNSRTGIPYRDDPTILAWETGNELASPHSWTREIAAYIKELDPSHLVLDGRQEEVLEAQSIENPFIDLLQTHHYEKDPRDMLAHIRESARKARGKKPYHVGEFGFLSTSAMTAVMDAIIEEGVVGGLVWSLRFHNRDGGFYWHHEPSGGDLFKAYHWPGFPSGAPYDEIDFLNAMRRRAFEIRGLPEPPVPVPDPPELTDVSSGGLVTWRGAAGASAYDVERRKSGSTEWRSVARNVSDANVQYRPLLVDESVVPGAAYAYRVRARNATGISNPSPPYGPIPITHRTFVDELRTNSKMFLVEGTIAFRSDQARRYKEDSHGIETSGGAAVVYHAGGTIIGGRIFLFADQPEDLLQIALSADGESFQPWETAPEEVSAGDVETYGYRKPFIYRFEDLPSGTRFVRLDLPGSDTRVTRVELDFMPGRGLHLRLSPRTAVPAGASCFFPLQ